MKEKKEIRPVRCFVCGKKMFYLREKEYEPEYKIYDYGEQIGYVHQKCVKKFKKSKASGRKSTIAKSHGMFELEYLETEDAIKEEIKNCEGKHIQQVCYSTYHDAFTQICFGCKKIRTNLQEAEDDDAIVELNETGGKNG